MSDIGAFDHMLFLLTITVAYQFWNWKKVFWSVTGFTIGHSIALAITSLNIINVNTAYVEFAIPITIAISALYSVWQTQNKAASQFKTIQFLFISVFGVIHGMGFSGYLGEMLPENLNILMPMLSFNIGIEAGQLLIVFFILALNYIADSILNISKNNWIIFWMGGAFCLSILLILENKLW